MKGARKCKCVIWAKGAVAEKSRPTSPQFPPALFSCSRFLNYLGAWNQLVAISHQHSYPGVFRRRLVVPVSFPWKETHFAKTLYTGKAQPSIYCLEKHWKIACKRCILTTQSAESWKNRQWYNRWALSKYKRQNEHYCTVHCRFLLLLSDLRRRKGNLPCEDVVISCWTIQSPSDIRKLLFEKKVKSASLNRSNSGHRSPAKHNWEYLNDKLTLLGHVNQMKFWPSVFTWVIWRVELCVMIRCLGCYFSFFLYSLFTWMFLCTSF